MKKILFLLFILPLFVQAEVAKCTNAKGRVIYSDAPCEFVKAKTQKILRDEELDLLENRASKTRAGHNNFVQYKKENVPNRVAPNSIITDKKSSSLQVVNFGQRSKRGCDLLLERIADSQDKYKQGKSQEDGERIRRLENALKTCDKV